MWKGKASQQDCVDDRELRCRAADAETEHEHGQKAKRLVFGQNAETDANILKERSNHMGEWWLDVGVRFTFLRHPSRNCCKARAKAISKDITDSSSLS